MSDIIPFESAKLPAYLTAGTSTVNDDLTAHSGLGFPVLSLKGKIWAISKDGERTVIPNPKDPDSPASSLEVVIIKASPSTSKIWYAKGYVEGAEATKPDCYSTDGIAPDIGSESPQAKACKLCPRNQWGSRVTDDGKKGKECQDSVRLAIANPSELDEPMLLRVPPASIRELGAYGAMLKKRGVDYTCVVTKLSFDVAVATPKLILTPVGFISKEDHDIVMLMREDDKVQAIVGAAPEYAADADPDAGEDAAAVAAAKEQFEQVVTKSKQVTTAEVEAALTKAAPKAVAKAAAKPAAAPAPEPAAPPAPAPESDIGSMELGDINFDD